MNKLKITNGKAIPNQFIINTPTHRVFQSYDTIIARRNLKTGKIELDKNYWDFSVTTRKYRNIFLNEGIAETRLKIKDKTYKLVDLNK